ncbi:MAG: hypothetical protein PF501_04240 [Salinisphaera sp.]|nr:hypothetical protein [Salinisphaera sp.]
MADQRLIIAGTQGDIAHGRIEPIARAKPGIFGHLVASAVSTRSRSWAMLGTRPWATPELSIPMSASTRS